MATFKFPSSHPYGGTTFRFGSETDADHRPTAHVSVDADAQADIYVEVQNYEGYALVHLSPTEAQRLGLALIRLSSAGLGFAQTALRITGENL